MIFLKIRFLRRTIIIGFFISSFVICRITVEICILNDLNYIDEFYLFLIQLLSFFVHRCRYDELHFSDFLRLIVAAEHSLMSCGLPRPVTASMSKLLPLLLLSSFILLQCPPLN